MFRRFRRRHRAGVDELSSIPNLAPSSESFDVSENAESCENSPKQSTTPIYSLNRIQSIQIDMIDESSNSEFDEIIREALVSRTTTSLTSPEKQPQILVDDSKAKDDLKMNDDSFGSFTENSEDAELLNGVDKRLHRFYKKRAKWKHQDGQDAKQKRNSLFGGWTLRTGKTMRTKPQATTGTIDSSWGGEKSSTAVVREEEPVPVEEFDDPLAEIDSGFDDIDRWKSRHIEYDDELVRDDSETKNEATAPPSRNAAQVELSKYIQLVERTKERLAVLRRSRIALEALLEGTKSDLQRAQSLVTRCTVQRKISSAPSANTDEFKATFIRDDDEQSSKLHPSGATSTVLEKPQDELTTMIDDGDISPPDTVLLIEQKKERLAVLRRSRCALEALMEGTKSDLKRAESLVEKCTAAWPSPQWMAKLIEDQEEGAESTIVGSLSSAETSSQCEESKGIRSPSAKLQFSPKDVMSRWI